MHAVEVMGKEYRFAGMSTKEIEADTRNSRMRVIREAVKQEARLMHAMNEHSAMRDMVSLHCTGTGIGACTALELALHWSLHPTGSAKTACGCRLLGATLPCLPVLLPRR